jgi:hypothetical protein
MRSLSVKDPAATFTQEEIMEDRFPTDGTAVVFDEYCDDRRSGRGRPIGCDRVSDRSPNFRRPRPFPAKPRNAHKSVTTREDLQ